MKELLTALINSNNESGKHIKYLYEKYCKLIYEVDYGNKIYESEELFTDFIKYIFGSGFIIIKYEFTICIQILKIKGNSEIICFNKKSSPNSYLTHLRGLLTTMGLEQYKNSNLNTLKNAKIH